MRKKVNFFIWMRKAAYPAWAASGRYGAFLASFVTFLAERLRSLMRRGFLCFPSLYFQGGFFLREREVFHCISIVFLVTLLTLTGEFCSTAQAAQNLEQPKYDWDLGLFAGKFYDSSPASFVGFEHTKFLDHYIIGGAVARNIYRMDSCPLSIEIEGLLAAQFGKDELFEVGIAPRITWSGFPWNDYVFTRFRVAPIGVSVTSSKNVLEQQKAGTGKNLLYYAFFEVALSPPDAEDHEFFLRLHHRCAFFDSMGKNINGEDFFMLGYRKSF